MGELGTTHSSKQGKCVADYEKSEQVNRLIRKAWKSNNKFILICVIN